MITRRRRKKCGGYFIFYGYYFKISCSIPQQLVCRLDKLEYLKSLARNRLFSTQFLKIYNHRRIYFIDVFNNTYWLLLIVRQKLRLKQTSRACSVNRNVHTVLVCKLVYYCFLDWFELTVTCLNWLLLLFPLFFLIVICAFLYFVLIWNKCCLDRRTYLVICLVR